jgi:hypothetical protein
MVQGILGYPWQKILKKLGVAQHKFLVYVIKTGFLSRESQAAPSTNDAHSAGHLPLCSGKTKMVEMILQHSQVAVQWKSLLEGDVMILVALLSYLLRYVQHRPKSLDYSSKSLNSQHYDLIQLFSKLGFLVFCCVARRCF